MENLLLWIEKKPTARLNDSITSLSHGLFQECGRLLLSKTKQYITHWSNLQAFVSWIRELLVLLHLRKLSDMQLNVEPPGNMVLGGNRGGFLLLLGASSLSWYFLLLNFFSIFLKIFVLQRFIFYGHNTKSTTVPRITTCPWDCDSQFCKDGADL